MLVDYHVGNTGWLTHWQHWLTNMSATLWLINISSTLVDKHVGNTGWQTSAKLVDKCVGNTGRLTCWQHWLTNMSAIWLTCWQHWLINMSAMLATIPWKWRDKIIQTCAFSITPYYMLLLSTCCARSCCSALTCFINIVQWNHHPERHFTVLHTK